MKRKLGLGDSVPSRSNVGVQSLELCTVYGCLWLRCRILKAWGNVQWKVEEMCTWGRICKAKCPLLWQQFPCLHFPRQRLVVWACFPSPLEQTSSSCTVTHPEPAGRTPSPSLRYFCFVCQALTKLTNETLPPGFSWYFRNYSGDLDLPRVYSQISVFYYRFWEVTGPRMKQISQGAGGEEWQAGVGGQDNHFFNVREVGNKWVYRLFLRFLSTPLTEAVDSFPILPNYWALTHRSRRSPATQSKPEFYLSASHILNINIAHQMVLHLMPCPTSARNKI